KPVGYFSFGNVGDSYTNYMIRGPLHKKTTLLDKYFDLIKADVDVLTSGAEAFDEKFAKVKDFGIELFDVNDLIFKDDSITFDNKHIFMARMESNKAQIKERIAEQLKQRYKNYKKSMKQRGIEAKADMRNKHFVQREEIQGGEIFTSIKEGTFEIAFLNREYYMIAMNRAVTVHPAFFVEYVNFSKRVKQVHTSGEIPYTVPTGQKKQQNYIVLEDKETSVDPEVMAFIQEQALPHLKKLIPDAFGNSKGTDSGALMSLRMVKSRHNDGRAYSRLTVEYLDAQNALDFAKIKEYESR